MSLAIHRIITVTEVKSVTDCSYILQNHFVEISPCDVHHSYERLRSKLKLVNTGLFSSVGFFTFC